MFVCVCFACLCDLMPTGKSLWASTRDNPRRGRLHLCPQPPPDGQGDEDEGEQEEKGGFKKKDIWM